MIADTSCRSTFPVPPVRGDIFEACAYWETLNYLLSAVLGWKQIDKGLSWWYEQSKHAIDDERLLLMTEIWNSENQLDYFAAWCWLSEYYLSNGDLNPEQISTQNIQPDKSWWNNFKQKGRKYEHDPFYGGTNPLHLGHSEYFGFDPVEKDQSLFHIQKGTRRAVLIVNNLGSWRRDLQNSEIKLSDLDARSWHVEVFDRQTGYLGLYRKSRVTGSWFMGKHSLHMKGN